MGIEDLKRWHWITIGVLVGLALAYVWNGVEAPSIRNVSAAEFQRDLTARDEKLGPWARRVVIHPPEPNFEAIAAQDRIRRYESEARSADEAAQNPPADTPDRAGFIRQKQQEAAAARARAAEARTLELGKRVNLVTYQKLRFDPKSKKNVLVNRQFIAEIPFVPPGSQGTQVDPTMTVARYLDELQKRYSFVSYSNGWWTAKPASYALWTIGSVVVIGGLWPVVINAMIGAGMGRKRDAGEPAFKLSKYKSTSHASTPAPAKPKVTADDEKRLHEMTDKLEHDLAGAGLAMTQAAPAAAAATPAGVRKLEGGPLETASLAPNPDADDEIEVKGEYYPVLIHHKKHHDDEHPADAEEKKD